MHVTSIKAAEFHWIILACMMPFMPVVFYTNIFSMSNFIESVKELDKQLEKKSTKHSQSHFSFHQDWTVLTTTLHAGWHAFVGS
jgi:hypothetical protein